MSETLIAESDFVLFLDLARIDSFVSIAATSEMITGITYPLRLLPLNHPLGNVAEDVKSQKQELQSYQARRAYARAANLATERRRDYARLGLTATDRKLPQAVTYAHLGLLHLDQCQAELAEKFSYLDAYLQIALHLGGAPVPDAEIDATLAGLGRQWVDSGLESMAEQMTRLDDEISTKGILSAPAFFLKGQRYIGQQHLPYLNWTLSGCNGVAPV